MITIYSSSNCSSCKKAKKWLKDHDISFIEYNLDSHPLSINDIKKILHLTELGTDEIISTRSNIFQKLNINLNQLSMKSLYNLIKEHPSILKKPIIFDEKRLQIGFNKEEIRQFLPRKARAFQLQELAFPLDI